MGCGCGKGRQGTAAVKDRKRTGAGTMNSLMSGQTIGTVGNSAYNNRVSDYNKTLRDYMRGK